MTICLLISGELGFNILLHLLRRTDIGIHSILTDSKSNKILEKAKEYNIYIFKGNPRNKATEAFFKNLSRPDILLSVNYLFLIEDDLIKLPRHYAINIHGSLLPKYRGRTPHVWAIINNEKKTGITAHLITSNCDAGDIIEQIQIPITKRDTGGSLLQKYNIKYPQIVDSVLQKINTSNIVLIQQNMDEASTFPKRTPEEGEIDWNWQKERIYNWVRAMSPPEYPGAFTIIAGHKIVIKKIKFSNRGFNSLDENGKIYSYLDTYLIIKTPNGCVNAYIHNIDEYHRLSYYNKKKIV